MAGNRLTLIKTLHSTSEFDERFLNPQVVNCDPSTGARKGNGGCFSVVFHAVDKNTGRPVALKFFDPDYHSLQEQYRRDLFVRESQLLERITGTERCLQLIQPLREFDIELYDPVADATIQTSFQYIATEWLTDHVEAYFFNQAAFSAQEKLLVWREIALAAFALHRHGLFHRDLKFDNVRVAPRGSRNIIVTIDLGTAAAVDSPPTGSRQDYTAQVGAPAFAPLEAKCGLASNRELGIYSDIYALGTMLHDLFNSMWHFKRQESDSGFQRCYGMCHLHMSNVIRQGFTSDQLRDEWNGLISLNKHMVRPPDIEGPSHSVPPAIRDPLNDVTTQLTAIDYRDRTIDYDYLLRRIDSAIRLLHMRDADARARERKSLIRKRRLEKARRRACGQDDSSGMNRSH